MQSKIISLRCRRSETVCTVEGFGLIATTIKKC